MTRTQIHTDDAPAAVGPYSQAIVANGMVFTAGQIALVPGTSDLVAGGISEQTRQVLTNVRAVLTAAGTDFSRVVKTTVFLTTMDDFQAMNAVYAEFFPAPYPARSTVAVAGLPRGARVEIETIALL